jgi:hypothetical protein
MLSSSAVEAFLSTGYLLFWWCDRLVPVQDLLATDIWANLSILPDYRCGPCSWAGNEGNHVDERYAALLYFSGVGVRMVADRHNLKQGGIEVRYEQALKPGKKG